MLLAVFLIAAGVAALSHVAPFPLVLEAITGSISVWRVPPGKGTKDIYLTFDDGPNPTATPQLLDLLKERNVQATFFLIEDYVDETTATIVRRMFDEGHAVAQHTGERWLLLRSPDRLAAHVRASADRIEKLTGRRPCPLFRPHGGWRSVSMMKGLRSINYRLVGWSWMSWDWVWFRKRTGPRVARQVLGHAAPGNIVVIHDGHHKNPRADRQYAIDAAARIIDRLRADGYRFRAMCEASETVGAW